MSARKPPRTRGAKPRPRPAAVAPLEPFKIVGQLVGARKNEAGAVIGEEVMGKVAIYAAQFGELEKLVQESVAAARDADTPPT
jgi:hypothetical protein